MLWSVPETIWNNNTELLKMYHEKNRHGDVPYYYKMDCGMKLGFWCGKQREEYVKLKA
jgi:hypothetical protein